MGGWTGGEREREIERGGGGRERERERERERRTWWGGGGGGVGAGSVVTQMIDDHEYCVNCVGDKVISVCICAWCASV